MVKYREDALIKKIQTGIAFLEKQDKKLQPVIDYLTDGILNQLEELPVDKKFEYFIQFMSMKNEGLLLLTKMKEILEYKKKEKILN